MNIDLITQKLISTIVNEDGSVSYELEPRETPLEIADHHVYHDQQWVSVRRERDRLLAETDWLVARAFDTGQPVPAQWVAYRQALRDVAMQNNPFFIQWPTKPSSVEPLPTTTVVVPGEETL